MIRSNGEPGRSNRTTNGGVASRADRRTAGHIMGTDPTSTTRCPHCRSHDNSRLCRTPGNIARSTFNLVIWLGLSLPLLVTLLGVLPEFDFVPVLRRCRRCGAVFSWNRVRSRKLDECVRCGYSLNGNVSGRCSECGWKLRKEHRRFVREAGIRVRTKSTNPEA